MHNKHKHKHKANKIKYLYQNLLATLCRPVVDNLLLMPFLDIIEIADHLVGLEPAQCHACGHW